jgi:hypothetical protein
MKKKQEKSKEEIAVEGNFKVDKNDLKYSTEKKVKEGLSKENILKNVTEKLVKTTSAEVFRQGSIKKNNKSNQIKILRK